MILKGRAWVFGDNLDVDWQICDLDELQQSAQEGIVLTQEEMGRRCLVRVNPEFSSKARPGDILVAGEGVGYSAACLDGFPEDPHRHAVATQALKGVGIAAILCESVVATFERNCLENGLPVVQCRGITQLVATGDELAVDLGKGCMSNKTTGALLEFKPLPPFLLQMIEAGGLYQTLGQSG